MFDVFHFGAQRGHQKCLLIQMNISLEMQLVLEVCFNLFSIYFLSKYSFVQRVWGRGADKTVGDGTERETDSCF